MESITDEEWKEKKAGWKDYVIEYMKSIRQEKPVAQERKEALHGKIFVFLFIYLPFVVIIMNSSLIASSFFYVL